MSDNLRVNISIRKTIQAKAADLMKIRDFDNFSEFLATLIREEHERRHGPALMHDVASADRTPANESERPTPPPPARPVSYQRGTKAARDKLRKPRTFGEG